MSTHVDKFQLDVNDITIWNRAEFLKFLVEHQNKPIEILIPEGVDSTVLGIYNMLDLFQFTTVTVQTHNLVGLAPLPYTHKSHDTASFQYFDVPLGINYYPDHVWNGNKIFGALYNRPTWSRLGVTGHLLTHHADKSSINFRFDPNNIDSRKFFELAELFNHNPASAKDFMNICNQLPLRLEEQDGYTVGATTQQHTDQLSRFYRDFLIDIVVETAVRGQSFYPTEKTTRPMLLKKPFIVMGPKSFLIHLRQMGFKTFYEFWDEDYDGYDLANRYNKILQVIDSIATKSADELHTMYQQMQHILEHNYKLIVSKTFSKKITYVE